MNIHYHTRQINMRIAKQRQRQGLKDSALAVFGVKDDQYSEGKETAGVVTWLLREVGAKEECCFHCLCCLYLFSVMMRHGMCL